GQVEGDPDVVGRRAVVGIELRDVAALGDDELTLLRALGAGGAGQRRGQCGGGAGDAGRLQQLATGETAHEAPPGRVLLFAGTRVRLSRARAGATIRDTMRTADVVVIGGGVNGASTAFHLTTLGVRDVLLVERRHLAAGATGKSGALVRMHYTNDAESRLALESLKIF